VRVLQVTPQQAELLASKAPLAQVRSLKFMLKLMLKLLVGRGHRALLLVSGLRHLLCKTTMVLTVKAITHMQHHLSIKCAQIQHCTGNG
jgi:hypothetical protein